MADTSELQEAIEAVRSSLASEYGVSFQKRSVRLRTGGSKTFNAVADDGSVVATISNYSGLTAGGKKPVGKVKGAIAAIYFLSIADAPSRVLVLTDHDFYEILTKEMAGALAEGVAIVHAPLPASVAETVRAVRKEASKEMTG